MLFESDMDTLCHSNEKAQCEIGIIEKYFFLGKGSSMPSPIHPILSQQSSNSDITLKGRWPWYAYVWLHAMDIWNFWNLTVGDQFMIKELLMAKTSGYVLGFRFGPKVSVLIWFHQQPSFQIIVIRAWGVLHGPCRFYSSNIEIAEIE